MKQLSGIESRKRPARGRRGASALPSWTQPVAALVLCAAALASVPIGSAYWYVGLVEGVGSGWQTGPNWCTGGREIVVSGVFAWASGGPRGYLHVKFPTNDGWPIGLSPKKCSLGHVFSEASCSYDPDNYPKWPPIPSVAPNPVTGAPARIDCSDTSNSPPASTTTKTLKIAGNGDFDYREVAMNGQLLHRVNGWISWVLVQA